MDESMVMVCMQIITNTGSAKIFLHRGHSEKAKKRVIFGGAEISMNEGDDLYAQAHEVHTSLIQKEASGVKKQRFFPDPDACRRSDGKYGNGQGNGKGVY